jgi:uncharacterized damage-inducible protein DinB
MDEYLLEAFRHNVWANKRLIAFCRDLTSEQLAATTQGTYGSILDTLNHVVASDAGYLPRPKIKRPEWAGDDHDIQGLDVLEARVDETAPLWERYVSDPLDAQHLLLLDEGAYEAQASIPVAQALHHGNVHREQVCSILTSLGLEPPDLQVWAYAEETGRAHELRPESA